MLSEIGIRFKGFILIPIITKIFGAANYGIWVQISVLQTMISPLVIFGLDATAVRFVSGKEKSKIAQSFSTLYIFIFTGAFIAGALIIVFSPFISESFFLSKDDYKFVILVAPAILFTSLHTITKCYYFIINHAKMVTFIKLIESFLPILPLLVVLYYGLGLFYLVSADILSLVLVAILSCFLLIRIIGYTRPDFNMLSKYLRYGAAVMPSGYAMWVLNSSDRLYIASFYGLKELGIYAVAYSFGYLFINLFFNPLWAMYPARATEFYTNNNLDQLNSLFQKSTKAAFFFIIPIIFSLWPLGGPILRVFTTEEFVFSCHLIPLVTIAYTAHMFSAYFTINLLLANKPILTTINICFCALINLILNYFLIQYYGILGAALSTFLSFMLNLIIEIFLAIKYSKIRLAIDLSGFYKCIISSIIMIMVLYYFQSQHVTSLFNLMTATLLGLIIYVTFQLIVKFINYDEAISILMLFKLQRFSNSCPLNYLLSYLR